MSADHELVRVPRVAVNDDRALLVAWTKKDGERVEAEDEICELEFSKSVVVVSAPRAGWLFHLRQEGEEVAVGAPLAAIAGQAERPVVHEVADAEKSGVKVTAKARALIELHGLDVAIFRGIDIVKEKHVETYLETRGQATDESAAEGEMIGLTPIRRRAALTLTESKLTVPHSYVSRALVADRVDGIVEGLATRDDMMVSVSDLLVRSVARAASSHPRANASWRQKGIFLHARANVGFALNQANGDLLVPVIQDAGKLSLEELVGRIRGYQVKAVRHKLAPEDLGGGTITVTSLVGTGAHQVFPILVPGQAVIIALGDPCTIHAPRTYTLTAAFDHRVMNGAEAAQFLAAVAHEMEGDAESATTASEPDAGEKRK